MPTDSRRGSVPFELTAAQRRYFDTFGFLHLPALFEKEARELDAAFEEVFANAEHKRLEVFEPVHFGERRLILPVFIDKHPRLAVLRDDPRIVGIVRSLIGADSEYAESDGNLFFCDSSWHIDSYGAPVDRFHIKLSFYLDPQDTASGAIRLIPGSNHYQDEYALTLRQAFSDAERLSRELGIEPQEVPSWEIESKPGDLLVWNYRTIHASFGGGERRRLFSISFREPAPRE